MRRFLIVLAILLGCGVSKAPAEEQHTAPPPAPLSIAVPDDYCGNIASKAADARYLLQKEELKRLREDLASQVEKLDKKRQEVEAVLARRDAEMRRASRELVDIYAKMKPDAAAGQLAVLDPETAAAILRQLNARGASTILNEMPADIAAVIAARLAVSSPPKEQKEGRGS